MYISKTIKNRNRLDEREVIFLANYYGADSPTKGNMTSSALAAGYSESVALTKAPRILKKFKDCGFSASADAVGLTNPYLAFRLKAISELPVERFAKEVLAAIRLKLAISGETTDDGGKGGNVNITGPTMVIVGASAERMKALRSAAVVPTREQLEQESNERGAARLAQLKRGELEPITRHSKAKREDEGVIDVVATEAETTNNADDDGEGGKAEPPAG